MQKRSPFSIAVRILTPIIIVLAIHAMARMVWVWNIPMLRLRDTRDLAPRSCMNTSDIASGNATETAYWDCIEALRERTFWNYATSDWGHVQAHFVSFLALFLSVILVIGIILWIHWAFYSTTASKTSGEENEDEPYVSECSDPYCRCNEHTINDRFDTNLNRWVEKDESLQETSAS